MEYDNNVKKFIDGDAEEFYRILKPLCNWNARYWEQLSLLKMDRFFATPEDRFLLEESIQNARSAISREAHPFSLTTLAKVLFAAMEKSPEQRDMYFGEAWSNILAANERERRWTSRGATLFMIGFSYSEVSWLTNLLIGKSNLRQIYCLRKDKSSYLHYHLLE